jgi:hypothetical protein
VALAGLGGKISSVLRSIDWKRVATNAAVGAGIGGVVSGVSEAAQGGSFIGGAIRGAMGGAAIGGAFGAGSQGFKNWKTAATGKGTNYFSKSTLKQAWGAVNKDRMIARGISGAAIGGTIGGIRSASEGEGFKSGFIGGALLGGAIGAGSEFIGSMNKLSSNSPVNSIPRRNPTRARTPKMRSNATIFNSGQMNMWDDLGLEIPRMGRNQYQNLRRQARASANGTGGISKQLVALGRQSQAARVANAVTGAGVQMRMNF